MPNNPITLDDIFALFRESEQERKEYQRAFEERQRAFEEHQRAYQLERELERKAYQQAFEERQRTYEQERKAYQQAFEERQRIAEMEMEKLRKNMEKTDQQIAQTNKQVGGLTSRWGEFVENLIKPAAARLFKEQGIDVHLTALRVEAQDEKGSMEIDILVENTNEVVAIEVKSHLEVRDIKQFLQTLERFKEAFPRYKNYKLYGAVAGIKIDERSDLYATQEGLYVIKPAGDSVIISNSHNVEPKIW